MLYTSNGRKWRGRTQNGPLQASSRRFPLEHSDVQDRMSSERGLVRLALVMTPLQISGMRPRMTRRGFPVRSRSLLGWRYQEAKSH